MLNPPRSQSNSTIIPLANHMLPALGQYQIDFMDEVLFILLLVNLPLRPVPFIPLLENAQLFLRPNATGFLG